MTGCRDMGKNIKIPPKWLFSLFVTPKIQALSLLYPYGDLTSHKTLEKANGISLSYLKMDRPKNKPTDNRGDYKGPLWKNWGPIYVLWKEK